MASAGKKLPTRILFNSSMLLIPIPISKIPPVAVISFIMAVLTMAFNCAAKRLIVPW